MRDCLFLVADKNMEATFKGFLGRDGFQHSLCCGEFGFDPSHDLVYAAADNDPGLFVRGHELLRPYQSTHRHAVVVLDAEWDGSPGAEVIQEKLRNQIVSTGWSEESFAVIVIDPELEMWIWQQNNHVATALGADSMQSLLADDAVRQAWPDGQAKPDRPKEVLEAILKKNRIPRSSAIYKKITSQVSVQGCQDGSFLELLETLRNWFPVEVNHG